MPNLETLENVSEIQQNVIENYPHFIASNCQKLQDKNLPTVEKIILLKTIYYDLTRFTGLICISDYLHRSEATALKELDQLFPKMGMPVDSTWKGFYEKKAEK